MSKTQRKRQRSLYPKRAIVFSNNHNIELCDNGWGHNIESVGDNGGGMSRELLGIASFSISCVWHLFQFLMLKFFQKSHLHYSKLSLIIKHLQFHLYFTYLTAIIFLCISVIIIWPTNVFDCRILVVYFFIYVYVHLDCKPQSSIAPVARWWQKNIYFALSTQHMSCSYII